MNDAIERMIKKLDEKWIWKHISDEQYADLKEILEAGKETTVFCIKSYKAQEAKPTIEIDRKVAESWLNADYGDYRKNCFMWDAVNQALKKQSQ